MVVEGLKLMLLGMGMVFSFLLLLYLGIGQLGRIYAGHAASELAAENAKSNPVRKPAPEAKAPSASTVAASAVANPAPPAPAPTDDQTLIAVIGAAVAAFRKERAL